MSVNTLSYYGSKKGLYQLELEIERKDRIVLLFFILRFKS